MAKRRVDPLAPHKHDIVDDPNLEERLGDNASGKGKSLSVVVRDGGGCSMLSQLNSVLLSRL